MDQEVRFATTSDGVRLAYARHGHGPPLVRASNWLTHLEYDWESNVWRPWLEELGRAHTVIRHDMRGCGMSDRQCDELGLERWTLDLETVLDAAEIERCTLLGISGGAAIALRFAALHPERVEKIVLYGGWIRGRFLAQDPKLRELFRTTITSGWQEPHPAFRRLFTMMFLPEATPEQMKWFDELQRKTIEPEMAARIYDALIEVEAEQYASDVKAPALVLHTRGDLVVPLGEGRRIAAAVPEARMVTLESPNHIILSGDPGWPQFVDALGDFLDVEPAPPEPPRDDLSTREREVMKLVAQGYSNDEIAERLVLSVRTVERHLSNVYVKLRVTGKSARAAAAAHFSRSA